MLRFLTVSLCQRAEPLFCPIHNYCSSNQPENRLAVYALNNLLVDVSKIRKLKGWVLHQSPAYVMEAAALLRGMGASGPIIARVFELHPEAILCRPEDLEAQKELWMSVCASQRDLVGIIEKFPASFFSSPCYLDNQRANVAFFRSLGLNKRIVAKLMASAPQSFSRSVKHNEEMVQNLQNTYMGLGGNEASMKVWLQKLLSQNPYVFLKPSDSLQNNLMFLQGWGFTNIELLHMLSKLKGFVTELQPGSMRLTLSYSKEMLGCTDSQLRQIVLKCPALLYFAVPVLEDKFRGLFSAGVSLKQVIETPTVLELTTQIVQYRIQKLRPNGYDIRTGSLEVLSGTKKDFEMSYGKLQERQERPLFNPVAPLKTDD